MGRPRKDATTQDVRERLIVAMADRLIREPASAVTVTSLIKEVGCNRSTFYYYFADTEQLAEAALDAVVPVEIPRALLSLIRQGAFSLSPATPNIPDLVQRNAQGIDTLCAVLNGPNAALAQKRVKRRLLEDVLPDLGVSLSSNTDDPTSRIVFEYATGGLLPRRNGFRLPRRDLPALPRSRSPRRPARRPFGEKVGSCTIFWPLLKKKGYEHVCELNRVLLVGTRLADRGGVVRAERNWIAGRRRLRTPQL